MLQDCRGKSWTCTLLQPRAEDKRGCKSIGQSSLPSAPGRRAGNQANWGAGAGGELHSRKSTCVLLLGSLPIPRPGQCVDVSAELSFILCHLLRCRIVAWVHWLQGGSPGPLQGLQQQSHPSGYEKQGEAAVCDGHPVC